MDEKKNTAGFSEAEAEDLELSEEALCELSDNRGDDDEEEG